MQLNIIFFHNRLISNIDFALNYFGDQEFIGNAKTMLYKICEQM